MKNLSTAYIFTRKKTKFSYFEKIVLTTLFLSILAFIFWLVQWEIVTANKLSAAVSRVGYSVWISPALFVSFFLVQLIVTKSYQSTYLIFDQDGLHLKQNGTSFMARLFFFERKILWSELKNATYLSRFSILQLRSKKTSLIWGIRAKEWAQKNDAAFSAITLKIGISVEPDLIRVLRENGVFDSFPKDEGLASIEFDLMAHAGTRNFLIGMSVLLAYCVLDGFLQTESWAFFNLSYCLPHLVIAVAAMILFAARFASKRHEKRIPLAITFCLSLFGATLIFVTSYVGGIRINQILGGPMVDMPYKINTACDTLIPDNEQLPPIEYTALAKPYWCSKGEDALIMVKVRKGIFGLYQVNLGPHTEAIRDYRQTH